MSRLTTYKLKGISATLGQVTIPGGHTFRIDGILDLSTNRGAFQLPTGTTAQRPGSPAVGYMRFNTDNNIIEVYSNDSAGDATFVPGWVDYDFAALDIDTGADVLAQYLVYSVDSGGDARNPTSLAFGDVTISNSGVNMTDADDAELNAYPWQAIKFTSRDKPYVQWRFARSANTESVLSSLANPYASWTMGRAAGLTVTPIAGSSGSVARDLQFMHENSGTESHDMPTLGELGGSVWGTGMYWGNIDSTTNYGGLLNTPYPHSGSGGGNTGDRLLVYLEATAVVSASDYTNYMTPTGPLGDATNLTWTSSGGGGINGDISAVADAIDRDVTTSWPTYGYQHADNTGWIQVDLGAGNAQAFDYTFVIGYPGGSHWSDSNEIQASNDNSNFTTLSQWRYHNGGDYSNGYLYHSNGNHLYSNTVNNSNKWHPIYNDGTEYRYWRLRGFNFNVSNGYQLVMNWGLLKRNA